MATETLTWANATPATLDQVDGTQCYQLGIRFTSATAQTCSGVQWRVPTTVAAPQGGPHAVAIWNVSSGLRVAYQEFTPVTGGYQNVTFTGITLSAGVTYIACVYTNHYAFRSGGVAVSSPSGNLTSDSAMLLPYNGGAAGALIPTTTSTTNFYVSPIVDAPSASTTPVTSTLTAKWNVRNAATSTLTAKWRVYNRATSTFTAKWRIYNAVNSTFIAKWRIFSGVTNTLTSKWRVYNRATATLTAKWRVFSGVTSTLTSKWRVFAGVTSTLTAKWRVYQQITSTLTSKWTVAAVAGTVMSSLTVPWRVYSRVTSTVTARWRINGGVVSTLSSRWRVFGRVTSSIRIRWAINATPTPTPSPIGGYLAMQRKMTAALIADDPTEVVLVPRVRVNTSTGGWQYVLGTPRVSQTVKMVLLSSDQRPTITVAGVERLIDYHLVGPWNMAIAVGDLWESEDDTWWEVTGFTEGWDYMTKAFLSRHVPREVQP